MANSPTAPTDRRSAAPESKNEPQWRVTPSSDGRGEQSEDKPPLIPRNRRWWALFGGLLVLNLVLVFATGGAASRQQVPYQPFFVQQLEAGNVESISSLEDSIDGELRRAVRYDPPGRAEPVDVTLFKTQVPAFIDRAELTRLVTSQDVVVNARGPERRAVVLGEPAARHRAVAADRGRLALRDAQVLVGRRRHGRLRQVDRPPGHAERARARHLRRRGGHRRGRARAGGGRRLPQAARALPQARRADPARRAAVRAAGHGQDAAGARRRRRGQRRVLHHVGVRVRRGDRRHGRLARARPVQAGQGGRAVDHLHRRARRHRPLAPERRATAAATTSASRRSTRSSPRWTASSRTPT